MTSAPDHRHTASTAESGGRLRLITSPTGDGARADGAYSPEPGDAVIWAEDSAGHRVRMTASATGGAEVHCSCGWHGRRRRTMRSVRMVWGVYRHMREVLPETTVLGALTLMLNTHDAALAWERGYTAACRDLIDEYATRSPNPYKPTRPRRDRN